MLTQTRLCFHPDIVWDFFFKFVTDLKKQKNTTDGKVSESRAKQRLCLRGKRSNFIFMIKTDDSFAPLLDFVI